jgi:FkbM family methyltransferase
LKTESFRKVLRFTSPLIARLNPKLRFQIAKLVKIEAFRTLFDPNSMRNYAHLSNKPTLVKIKLNSGSQMFVDLNDIMGFRTALAGVWDDTALRVIQQFPVQNTLYIDIGANIGLTSIPIAKLGYETLAFEPNPVALSLITKNLAINDIDRFYLFPFALGSTSENVEMTEIFMPNGNLGASSTDSHWSPGIENSIRFNVPKISLDKVMNLLYSKEKLDDYENLIIKLDIEGQEDAAMEGSEDLINAKRPVLIFENNPPKDAEVQSVRFWSKWIDYKFFGHKIDKIEEFNEQKRYENVIAIPSEKLGVLGKNLELLLNSK